MTMTKDQEKLVTDWFNSLAPAAEAKKLVEAEQALRKQVIAICFPTPKEGVNHFDLGKGYTLTLDYKIDRKLDEDAFTLNKEKIRTEYSLDPNTVVTYKPSVSVSAVKSLKSTNELAYNFVMQFITEKPGSHSLELKPPKAKKETK